MCPAAAWVAMLCTYKLGGGLDSNIYLEINVLFVKLEDCIPFSYFLEVLLVICEPTADN
jgi:hypothetical protein